MSEMSQLMLTESEFEILRDLVYRQTHIRMENSKRILLSNRIRKRLRALNLESFNDYIRFINNHANTGEMERFLEVVTTNETYFYRDPDDYTLLTDVLIPRIIMNKDKITVFSAGCSTGEEAYEIAMHLDESREHNAFKDFQIHAMDISERCIQIAEKGEYPFEATNHLPAKYRSKYFADSHENEHVKIVRQIKERVKFVRGDLFLSTLPASDVVFCRNVMIYYTPDDRNKLLSRLHDSLNPGGFLILGGMENIVGTRDDFKSETFQKNSYYQKI